MWRSRRAGPGTATRRPGCCPGSTSASPSSSCCPGSCSGSRSWRPPWRAGRRPRCAGTPCAAPLGCCRPTGRCWWSSPSRCPRPSGTPATPSGTCCWPRPTAPRRWRTRSPRPGRWWSRSPSTSCCRCWRCWRAVPVRRSGCCDDRRRWSPPWCWRRPAGRPPCSAATCCRTHPRPSSGCPPTWTGSPSGWASPSSTGPLPFRSAPGSFRSWTRCAARPAPAGAWPPCSWSWPPPRSPAHGCSRPRSRSSGRHGTCSTSPSPRSCCSPPPPRSTTRSAASCAQSRCAGWERCPTRCSSGTCWSCAGCCT